MDAPVLSLFSLAAPFATIFYLIPTFLPFFAPVERPATFHTYFMGQIGLGIFFFRHLNEFGLINNKQTNHTYVTS